MMFCSQMCPLFLSCDVIICFRFLTLIGLPYSTLNIGYKFDKIADDLNSNENGEPNKEAHGSPNETQLSLELDLLVSLDLVKGGRDKNISLPKNDSELLTNSMHKKIMNLPKPPLQLDSSKPTFFTKFLLCSMYSATILL